MAASIQARRLMIYLGESDSWRGRSLYMTILETLRKSDIAGATVTRAIAGYGAHSRIRSQMMEVLSTDLPIVITVVDTPANIDRALSLVGPMVREGLITVEDVEIIKYAHRFLQPLPADQPVSRFMTRSVTSVKLDAPAQEVVKLLLGQLFRALPVVDDDNRVVGIITEGDLLRNAGLPVHLSISARLEASDLREVLAQVSQEKTASQIMTSPVKTARADEALGHVVQRMLDQQLKRLPVVDEAGHLIGMISRLDVLRAAAGDGGGQPEQAPAPAAGRTLGEIMSTRLPVVHIYDDLADVLQQVLQTDLRRVIVLDEQGKPAGVITDSDLAARVGAPLRRSVLQALAARVLGEVSRGQAIARDLMSEHVLSAPADLTVVEAINRMLSAGRKTLVVVDDAGYAIGLVDRQTLLAATLNAPPTSKP